MQFIAGLKYNNCWAAGRRGQGHKAGIMVQSGTAQGAAAAAARQRTASTCISKGVARQSVRIIWHFLLQRWIWRVVRGTTASAARSSTSWVDTCKMSCFLVISSVNAPVLLQILRREVATVCRCKIARSALANLACVATCTLTSRHQTR